jgi:outer membrane protein OmpA-like peptidoglycan-associated protein
MKVIAKCTNYSGCLVAYRGEKVELAEGAPLVCPECGKPLAVVKGGQGAIVKLAAVAVGVIAIGAVAFFGMKMISKKKPAPADPVPEVVSDTPTTAGNDTPPAPPVNPPDYPTPAPGPGPGPGPMTAIVDATPPGPAKADNTPVTEDIRAEVLKRIDAMPNIAPEKKDKLYNSVRRARDMRRIVVVPFGSGQTGIPGSEQTGVKNLLGSADVMKFRDDLTAVFVVLGFADSKGDDKSNLAISGSRARSVKEFMVKECAIKNVTHDVAMGTSKLVDEKKLEKNRIAEIWAVLP